MSENLKGRYIYFDTENHDENYAYCESAFVAMDGGDEVVIRICGVGLNDDNHSRMIQYWELPMEFAANMWVVDFVNHHIEAVEELCGIYLKYYEE